MRTAQLGDRARVHYVKRLQDGSVASSRSRGPLEVTVGEDHPRLPGLGLALLGMASGATAKISVPVELAYGPPDPSRVRRLPRDRFPATQTLQVGKWVPIQTSSGRRRFVRVVELNGETVVVDTNHRGAGQTLQLEVELVGIQG